jgi:hypothetical protein
MKACGECGQPDVVPLRRVDPFGEVERWLPELDATSARVAAVGFDRRDC